GVTIVGIDAAGAFHGVQSLLALLPGDVATHKEIPQLQINYDAPRYGYRGVQIDIARNFHDAASILKVLDQAAAYKLNALHLHLSDDEGFRLEIPGLPELTAIGSRRCHDESETSCILPQLGSGPDAETSGTGFLTRAEYVKILAAAAARHIEVIPEFDMPGHARAAIKAMEVRAAKGDAALRLSDPEDKSKYLSVQYYKDNALNGCIDSTYAFVGKLMDEVKKMHEEAKAPLRTWHVGADEVGVGAWTDSPACKALFAQNGEVKTADDVHGYFIKRVNGIAKEHGVTIRGWSDGLRKAGPANADGKPTKVFIDPKTDLADNAPSTNWWGTLFWWDNSVYHLANAGYKVILTSPDFLYLDHPYEADPKERGYYWGTRYTDVAKLFAYMPGNLPANVQLTKDRMGNDYTAAFAPTTATPKPVDALTSPENIVGMEAPFWSETVRSDAEVEYMVFPRLLAFAERAWH
ncbi:MAG: beta-N-acetylhexosaminidase, partial [Proteobacteria bacterium]